MRFAVICNCHTHSPIAKRRLRRANEVCLAQREHYIVVLRTLVSLALARAPSGAANKINNFVTDMFVNTSLIEDQKEATEYVSF
jgi:hypothetical protein